MAQKLYEEENIQAIADAIREMNGTTTTYTTAEMANAIKEIETGGYEINVVINDDDTQTLYIYDTGNSNSSGNSGGSDNVEPVLQDKTITANGTYTADTGYDGLGTVTVNVPATGGSEVVVNGFWSENTILGLFHDRNSLTEITLPDGATMIPTYFFNDCNNLVTVNMPDNLTTIESQAFLNCKKLGLRTLPSSLMEINAMAFYNCSSLAITEIPASVTTIGMSAFYNCTNLTTITFKGTPKSIYNNAFNGCTNITTINVPWAEGTVANAPWGATNATINYNYTGE